jgi:cholesterol oxidase
MQHDFDYNYSGSGFGGSVSALRLQKKDIKVPVIEKGNGTKRMILPRLIGI